MFWHSKFSICLGTLLFCESGFSYYARILSNIVRLVSDLNKQKHSKNDKLKDSSYCGREKRNALIINIFEFFS